ncbi:MAG: type I secretion C-terminal target domain-containing protein, partial [Gammaproteobacteria bacterium]
IDTVTDFNQNDTDVLDLRDIIDLSDGRTIEQWVSLETGDSTTVKIHANADDASEVTQTIVLTGYATVAGDDINTLISNNVVMTPDDSMA